ncbi:GAF sensor signal transduction histidine kinase [Aquimarina sp. MAR_2010_214]|uniref:sensor histidine kinase n=1 Tax=Aquimarina sp. MAR_2010_214 TaxID=1250026 RepID=UPI000C701A8A|nr:GAF domain-containing sensor histidine kinase [Aquimarina sp. MAR_2010_214]PKV51506.1 GAF sensor signal transduction histidine kinase [Aquimarina sp. MAR_2010_214]
MISNTIPINENFRLEALKSLNILDTESQKEFDEITALAAYICETDMALISLVDNDRQWFKSKHGLKTCETPRNNSLCSHVVLKPNAPLLIKDTRKDERFNEEPIILEGKPIIFYVGIPLVDKDGFALGSLCVMDSVPRELSNKQLDSLTALAKQVIILFELNKKNNDLQVIQNKLKKHNESLREFARVISHDLKMPLANVITSTDLLKLKLGDKLDNESLEYFDYIKASSFSMSNYISDVLDHYESESLIHNTPEEFYLNRLLSKIVDLLSMKPDFTIYFPEEDPIIQCNKLALKQIFFNLIGNSIKYNDKEQIIISIETNEDKNFYYFRITDNGMGIPNDKLDTIFELFTTANTTDRSGNKGNGIGLSTVEKLVENLGGYIKVSSKEKVQTTFEFSIKKSN